MAKELTTGQFNYSLFDADTKGKLIWYASEIRKQGESHKNSGLEIGKLLLEARDLCGDKPFRDWAPGECGCSLRTAYNYMAAYTDFGQCATVAHIELSAMYALTKNGRAKQKALKLAASGVTVTQATAKKLVKDEKAKKLPPKPPKPDLGKCPACAGTKWKKGDDGMVCSKCKHPHGEPAGDVDSDRIRLQRSKTVKTAEALMREFDDLNLLSPNQLHPGAINKCKELLQIAKGWK